MAANIGFPRVGLTRGDSVLASLAAGSDRIAFILAIVLVGQVSGLFAPNFSIQGVQGGQEGEYIGQMTSRWSGNAINQIVWMSLTVVTLFLVFTRKLLPRMAHILWPVAPLIALIFVSFLWSDHPDATMRRGVQQAFMFISIAGILCLSDSISTFWRAAFYVYLALLITSLPALALATSYDPLGNFRGFLPHKNNMGGNAAIGLLIAVAGRTHLRRPLPPLVFAGIVAGWALCLVMSGSKTSLGLVIFLLLFAFPIISRLRRFGHSFQSLALAVGVAVLTMIPVVVYAFFWGDVRTFFDTHTLTGRVPLWSWMFEQMEGDWLVGHGFGAFWAVGQSSANLFSSSWWVRFVTQAHNGYIDLLVQFGLFGVVVITWMMVHIYIAMNRFVKVFPEMGTMFSLFFYFFVLHNFMETSFARGQNNLWALFVAAALSAHTALGARSGVALPGRLLSTFWGAPPRTEPPSR